MTVPNNYFKFIAYNEVHDKADNNDAPLTGCIHRISDPLISGDATRSRKTRRIIDIQNLDGLNLPFVIWDEMAEKFDMDEYANMPKPVVIAVSSTWATTKYGGLQLTATPTTYYYLNLNILEVHYILDVYAQFINPTESLEIRSQPCRTEEEEKMRNRYSIEALLNVNPQHYQQTRFTTEATITKISATQGWYCFRMIIDDGTGSTTLTCFSPEAHTFAPDCNKLVNAVENKDKRCLPDALKQFENTTYIFQYRFGKNARPGYPNFSLDAAFKTSPQPLLSLPAPDSATTTPQEVLQQTSNAATPTPSEIDPHQLAEDIAKESDTSSTTTKKTAKRELFKDAKTSDKKPRQQD
ncbi:DNA helicase [Tanacetum coccineum]